MKRDLVTTFITEGLVIASYLLAFRLIADQLGTPGFSEYALARRTLAVLIPVGTLSLDIAVARYVAYAVGTDRIARYVPAAVAIAVSAVAVLSVVLLLFAGPFATLFFGSARYSGLIYPMPVLVLGGALHGIAYGALRGRSLIQRANLVMATNQFLVPLIAIVLVGGSVPQILFAMGAGWILASVVAIAIAPMSLVDLRPRLVELIRYSVPRMPGDLLRLTLFALPGVIVAHIADITVAGSLAFGVAAVGMLGTALSPVGFVLLPNAARMMASGSITELRGLVVRIAQLTALALTVAIVIVEIFAPQILHVYLGAHVASTSASLRVIIPAALPWGIYVSLGSVIDAHHVRPVNARNMAIAFAVFIAGAGVLVLFSASALLIAGMFVVSLYVLGALTLFEIHTITSQTVDAAAPLAPESQPL
jgi:O-antigen/teichoic acid export membrane protein